MGQARYRAPDPAGCWARDTAACWGSDPAGCWGSGYPAREVPCAASRLRRSVVLQRNRVALVFTGLLGFALEASPGTGATVEHNEVLSIGLYRAQGQVALALPMLVALDRRLPCAATGRGPKVTR